MVGGVVHNIIQENRMTQTSTTKPAGAAGEEPRTPDMATHLSSMLTVLATELRPVLGADTSPQARRVTAWLNGGGEVAEHGRFDEAALTALVCDLVTLRNARFSFALGPDRAVKPRRAVAVNDTGGAVALGAAVSHLVAGIGKVDAEMALRLARTALVQDEAHRRDVAERILAHPGMLSRF